MFRCLACFYLRFEIYKRLFRNFMLFFFCKTSIKIQNLLRKMEISEENQQILRKSSANIDAHHRRYEDITSRKTNCSHQNKMTNENEEKRTIRFDLMRCVMDRVVCDVMNAEKVKHGSKFPQLTDQQNFVISLILMHPTCVCKSWAWQHREIEFFMRFKFLWRLLRGTWASMQIEFFIFAFTNSVERTTTAFVHT